MNNTILKTRDSIDKHCDEFLEKFGKLNDSMNELKEKRQQLVAEYIKTLKVVDWVDSNVFRIIDELNK